MITEEEALKKYTPEEREKIVGKKHEKDQEFEVFITRLKEQTRSNKSST